MASTISDCTLLINIEEDQALQGKNEDESLPRDVALGWQQMGGG